MISGAQHHSNGHRRRRPGPRWRRFGVILLVAGSLFLAGRWSVQTARVDPLENRVDQLQTQATLLRNQVEELKEQLEQSKQEAADLTERNTALKERLEAAQRESEASRERAIELPLEVRERLGTVQSFVLASVTGNQTLLDTVAEPKTPRFPGTSASLFLYPRSVAKEAVVLSVSTGAAQGIYEFSITKAQDGFRVTGWRLIH